MADEVRVSSRVQGPNPTTLPRHWSRPRRTRRDQREVCTRMRVYEMMIIFHSDVDDSGIQQMLNRVNEMVTAGKGKVATTDRWGRRRFAYEIDHKLEGYYVVLEIVTEAASLEDISRFLRIADQVVRHKTMRLPEHEVTRRGLLGKQAS